jgi:hypothetical protein
VAYLRNRYRFLINFLISSCKKRLSCSIILFYCLQFAIFGLCIVVAIKPLITVGTSWRGRYTFFFCGATTQRGPDRLNLVAVYRLHTRQHSSEQVISLSQRPLNTQQAQKTKIHAHSAFRTRDLKNQAAADFRFRPYRKPESTSNVSLEIICLSVYPTFIGNHLLFLFC